jgi:dTDP-4-dehydrorhamnose reductase
MRIAVTGAGGGLGRAFLEHARDRHDVHPFTRQELDVRSFEATMAAIVPLEPDLIMHFAAMTAVDACEADPQRAADTNVGGSFNVAAAAREARASLVAISTDYVFDGDKGEPYDEDDAENPVSVYGLTKHAGEWVAAATAPDALIVRTAWVYGAGDDYFSRAVKRLKDGEEVGAITDLFGSPTHVAHLAERLLPLFTGGVRDVVHLAGSETVSWHGALARAKELGDLPGEVVAQKADELARPARRPVSSALASVVLDEDSGVPPMPPLDEGIRKVLSDVGA